MKYYRLGYTQPAARTDWLQQGPLWSRRSRLPGEFALTDDDLETHILALGTTGSGKSRFMWQALREHRRNQRGFCIVEPGDLIDDFLADCVRLMFDTGCLKLLKKLHIVELNPLKLAHYDPFRFTVQESCPPESQETVYRSRQHTKVQTYSEVYQWKQGQSTDFEGMPRLQRIFNNVFHAISTWIDGKRLTAADADILIDLGHPDHYNVYERLKPHLDRFIVSDFEALHSFKSMRDIRQETESFLNRIRSTHGPLLREMIATTPGSPSIDLDRIIQNGDFLLVKVGKTPYASADQNNALASMFIHDVIDTVLITPRSKRRGFTLAIDEAHKYVRSGIGDIARTARKYKLSLILATPDLTSLKKGDLDLTSELLSVVNTVVSFRLTLPEDLKRIAEFLYSQNIDFTELIHEVERRAGPIWIPVEEWSESKSQQTSTGSSSSNSVSNSNSQQDGVSSGGQQSNSLSRDRFGHALGDASSNGRSDTHSLSHTYGQATANQSGTSSSVSVGSSVTIQHKLVHIEKIVRELQKTGRLTVAVSDQLAQFAQIISGQSRRHATVRVREGRGFEIETALVRDPFTNPEAQAMAIEWVRQHLYKTHDYFFTPTISALHDERRIAEFLEGGPAVIPNEVTDTSAATSTKHPAPRHSELRRSATSLGPPQLSTDKSDSPFI